MYLNTGDVSKVVQIENNTAVYKLVSLYSVTYYLDLPKTKNHTALIKVDIIYLGPDGIYAKGMFFLCPSPSKIPGFAYHIDNFGR